MKSAAEEPETPEPPVSGQKDWYQDWFDSPWYDKLYRHRDEAEARAFLTRLLQELQPAPGSRVLDLACGSGRHARFLAGQGLEVTGVDLSPRNILAARAWENDHLSFYVHDMREPFRVNYFNYIFNFFTSFGYFEREQANLKSLCSIRKGLRAGGYLVLDFLSVPYAVQHLVPEEEREEDGVRFVIRRRFDGRFFIKDITVLHQELEHRYQERVRALTVSDFEAYFERAGLSIQRRLGSYSLEPYQPDHSPRLILLARKKPL
jgi:SAM-dependent methyltransferase